MKKSILFAVLLFLLPVICHAQQVTILYPTGNPTGLNWTEMAASANTSFTFIFPRTNIRTNYTGVVQCIVYVDTALAGVSHRDSLTVSAEPLRYDKTLDTDGVVSVGDLVRTTQANHDSVDVVNIYNWGTGDSDNTVNISAIADLPPCQGGRVNVYTGLNAACRIRVEFHITTPYGF